jgi:alkylation response protein AidB-like acyl-CoA dehydrogenase
MPKENLLGLEGMGFSYLIECLPQERLVLAVGCLAGAEAAFQTTVDYCKQRKAFGRSIGSFQHNRFVLAEMATELEVGRAFVDRCLKEHIEDGLSVERAAMAKWWVTELQKRIVDQCVQLHGGYGYMLEYDVAKMYLDSRVQTIYAGTTEIMKEIVGRSLGF